MLRFKNEESRSGGDYRYHPLATTEVVTIEMERDEGTKSFVTFVQELHGMSTFGETEFDALEMTAEMIRGYIGSMEERGMRIPLEASSLAKLKALVKGSKYAG